MAFPHDQFPKEVYHLSDTTEASAPTGSHFFAVMCLAGGAITLKGEGASLYKVNSGEYEDAANTGSAVTMAAGQTIYGKFSSVQCAGSATAVAYVSR
jgi:hypothetical protein